MKTSEELGKYLQTIIERHREDLSILLRENGINDEPTPRLLILLYEKAGDDFIHELARLGEEPFATLPLDHAEGTLVDRLSSFFQKAKAIVTGSSAQPNPASSQAAVAVAPVSTKKILLVGLAIVATLVVIYFLVKRSN